MERKVKILKDGDVVLFEGMTQKYGRAEFCICPIYKRGKLKELHITPLQQPNADTNYVIDDIYSDSFQLSSINYNDPVRAWLHMWCKEHKCPAFRIYVPDGVDRFTIRKLSTLDIIFSY